MHTFTRPVMLHIGVTAKNGDAQISTDSTLLKISPSILTEAVDVIASPDNTDLLSKYYSKYDSLISSFEDAIESIKDKRLDKAVIYEYNLFNSGGGPKTVTGIQCVLVHTTNLQEPSDGTVVTTQSQPNVTVPANNVITVSNKTFTHTRIANRTYWVGTSAVGIPMTYNQVEDYDGV